jgi:hypothetical protein
VDGGDVRIVVAGDDPAALADLEASIGQARAHLAHAEAVWSELFGTLSELQARYWVEVGSLVVAIAEARVELDRHKIAARAQKTAYEKSAPEAAARAKEARELRDEYRAWAARDTDQDQAQEPMGEEQRRELRALIVDAARRFHPDLARDADDVEQRTRLMAQANRLYAARDAGGLRRLLDSERAIDKSRRTNQHDKLLSQLHETLREHDRLVELTDALRASTWAVLQQQCEELGAQGIDPWDRLRIELTRELDELRAEISAFA